MAHKTIDATAVVRIVATLFTIASLGGFFDLRQPNHLIGFIIPGIAWLTFLSLLYLISFWKPKYRYQLRTLPIVFGLPVAWSISTGKVLVERTNITQAVQSFISAHDPNVVIGVITILTASVSIALYWLRQHHFLFYANLEICFALASVAASATKLISDHNGPTFPNVTGLVGGAYLLVRGLTNRSDAIKKREGQTDGVFTEMKSL